jgi:hypothetical protein
VNDFVTVTPILKEITQILTRHYTEPISKATEIGYFLKKHVAVTGGDGEPDPAINILRKKAATCLGIATLACSLVELRNTTLANIKVHLLGRDETGAITEPEDT